MEQFKQDLEEIKLMLNKQKQQHEDIYNLLVGVEKFQQKGLIQRIKTLETHREKQTRAWAIVTGISTGLALGFHKFIDWLNSSK